MVHCLNLQVQSRRQPLADFKRVCLTIISFFVAIYVKVASWEFSYYDAATSVTETQLEDATTGLTLKDVSLTLFIPE